MTINFHKFFLLKLSIVSMSLAQLIFESDIV